MSFQLVDLRWVPIAAHAANHRVRGPSEKLQSTSFVRFGMEIEHIHKEPIGRSSVFSSGHSWARPHMAFSMAHPDIPPLLASAYVRLARYLL